MAVSAYEVISTQTLGSAAASVTFSSIPQTYTDLVLVVSHDVTADAVSGVQFNGDTASNYSATYMWGQGALALSARETSAASAFAFYGSAASGFATAIIQVMNYSNTTTYKTFLSRESDAAIEALAVAGLWRSTAAITSMVLLRRSGNFDVGSTFTLYGIKAA
jgi:hypothetical protein